MPDPQQQPDLAGMARGIIYVALADCILAIGATLRGEPMPEPPFDALKEGEAMAEAMKEGRRDA